MAVVSEKVGHIQALHARVSCFLNRYECQKFIKNTIICQLQAIPVENVVEYFKVLVLDGIVADTYIHLQNSKLKSKGKTLQKIDKVKKLQYNSCFRKRVRLQ